jgi:hypothetical protein
VDAENLISLRTYKLIEIVLLFGLCFVFAGHQFRSLDRADREAREKKEREAAARSGGAQPPP